MLIVYRSFPKQLYFLRSTCVDHCVLEIGVYEDVKRVERQVSCLAIVFKEGAFSTKVPFQSFVDQIGLIEAAGRHIAATVT